MDPADDRRLYLPRPDQWTVRAKPNFDREYCHSKRPGEAHYHLLMGGELFVENGEQKYCLDCALRLGILTTDRLHWQRGRAEAIMPTREVAP